MNKDDKSIQQSALDQIKKERAEGGALHDPGLEEELNNLEEEFKNNPNFREKVTKNHLKKDFGFGGKS